MSRPLDELYLRWLYAQVGSVRHRAPARTHWSILRVLFTKEFIWIVPNDDNRVEDGRDLRVEFLKSSGVREPDVAWMELGCSMLEMLIGLSRRLSFETDREPRDWFWHFLHVLHLDHYTDDRTIPEEEVNEILDRVIWRTYGRDGDGGLFPLLNPSRDQRDVEIWYQLNEWLLELDQAV